ncbi:hypothetical protein HUU62_04825 [Rhodoferax sp. 4810]|nr:hypothetical protein [Rhodoferax jenense]
MSKTIDVRSARIFDEITQQLQELRLGVRRQKEVADEAIAELRKPLSMRRVELQEELEDMRRSLCEADEEDEDTGARHDDVAAIERNIRRQDQLLDEAQRLEARHRAHLEEFERSMEKRILASTLVISEKGQALAAYVQIQADGPAVSAGLALGSAVSSPAPDELPAPGSPLARLDKYRQSCTNEGLPEGFVWVDLTTLPDACFVHDETSFKKVRKSTMRRGVSLLFSEIIPELRRSPDAGAEYFARLDRERGTDYDGNGFVHPESLHVVWQAFLDDRLNNDNVIRISTIHEDGRVDLYSGRHRLAVARELGQRFMPVRIGTDRR